MVIVTGTGVYRAASILQRVVDYCPVQTLLRRAAIAVCAERLHPEII